MTYTANITFQGQLTIPKALRDKYGIENQGRAFITDVGDGFMVKTYTDNNFWALEGILKNNSRVKRNKGKSLQQRIDEEGAAFEQTLATKHD